MLQVEGISAGALPAVVLPPQAGLSFIAITATLSRHATPPPCLLRPHQWELTMSHRQSASSLLCQDTGVAWGESHTLELSTMFSSEGISNTCACQSLHGVRQR